MKRLDLTLRAQPLAQSLFTLAGSTSARRAQALDLLADHQRWDALLALARLWGRPVASELLRPRGLTPLLYRASASGAASVATLDGLRRLGGLPGSDAQVAAQARKLTEWERDKWPAAPSTLPAWLNEGLRWALRGGDVAHVQWWVAAGADLHHVDAQGNNALEWASAPHMLDWLLAQGVSMDGTCRHGSRVACTQIR